MKKKPIAPTLADTGDPNVTTTATIVQKKRRSLWATALFVLGGMCLAAVLGPVFSPRPAINTGQTLSSAFWSTLGEATNTAVPEAPTTEPTPVSIELTPVPVEPTPVLVQPPVFQVSTETATPPQ